MIYQLDLSKMKPFCECENPQVKFSLYETRCDNCGKTEFTKPKENEVFNSKFTLSTGVEFRVFEREGKLEIVKLSSTDREDMSIRIWPISGNTITIK